MSFADESTDSDGTIVKLLWDFNHGLPTEESNPVHTFPSNGAYRVTLLAWDNEGRGARYEEVIQLPVLNEPSVSNNQPIQSITSSTNAMQMTTLSAVILTFFICF